MTRKAVAAVLASASVAPFFFIWYESHANQKKKRSCLGWRKLNYRPISLSLSLPQPPSLWHFPYSIEFHLGETRLQGAKWRKIADGCEMREKEEKGVAVALMQRARPNCDADCLPTHCDRAQVQPIKHIVTHYHCTSCRQHTVALT